jgi:hypothetical protein
MSLLFHSFTNRLFGRNINDSKKLTPDEKKLLLGFLDLNSVGAIDEWKQTCRVHASAGVKGKIALYYFLKSLPPSSVVCKQGRE